MRLCIVAGEASGDHHAAAVLRELKGRVDSVEAFGFGGDELAREGMEVLTQVRDLAIVGLSNVVRHIPWYRRVMNELAAEVEKRRPEVVLFVDFPDFNLSLARKLRSTGIPLLYYISPQIWAWRRGRARTIAKLIDHMMVIFPFETDLYEERMKVTFVGHPILDRLSSLIPDGPRRLPAGQKKIAILPGSREMEIELLLPVMLEAVANLREEHDLEPVLIKADTIDREVLEKVTGSSPGDIPITEGDGAEELATCHLAVASSGTVTLEAAVLGIPTVVLYRLPILTYLLAKMLVDLEHYSLVNIVAEREVVPELIQGEASPRRIEAELKKLMNEGTYDRVARELVEVRERLGEGGAARNVADIVMAEASR